MTWERHPAVAGIASGDDAVGETVEPERPPLRSPAGRSRSAADGDLRLLGDGRGSALVGADGSIPWWCTPRADSAPLLWRLLSGEGAGAEWEEVREGRRLGVAAGPSLRGQLTLVGGDRVATVDALLPGKDGDSLIRLVCGLDADLAIVHRLSLGGLDLPWAEWNASSALLADGRRLRVRGGASTAQGRVLHTTLSAPAGSWSALTITFGDDDPGDDAPHLLDRCLRLRGRSEREGMRSRVPASLSARADSALAVLRTCSTESGAVIASPTTSVPEAPDGDRQWDYRYCWLRDAAVSVAVASLLGRPDQARRYLDFIHRAGANGLNAVRTIDGTDVPSERIMSGLPEDVVGPVRIGNDASGQIQHDAFGMLIEAVSVYLQEGGRLDGPTWKLVRRCAERAASADDQEPTHGIWELRTPRLLVSADIGRWLILDRALWIARAWRPWTRRGHWRAARNHLRERVLGAMAADGSLPQEYGGDPHRADASALMIPLFRLLPRRDPRASAILDATVRRLADGPHVYRYPSGPEDGFTGLEASFVPMSWWRIGALANLGRIDEARSLAAELDAVLPVLLPEEWDPSTSLPRGNRPLVWSHMEAARAGYLLDAAVRRRRRGLAGLTAWRLGRYLSMRTRGVR